MLLTKIQALQCNAGGTQRALSTCVVVQAAATRTDHQCSLITATNIIRLEQRTRERELKVHISGHFALLGAGLARDGVVWWCFGIRMLCPGHTSTYARGVGIQGKLEREGGDRRTEFRGNMVVT